MRAFLWCALLLAVLAATVWRLETGTGSFSGDFLSLVGAEASPQSGGADDVEAARHIVAQDAGRAIFLLSGKDRGVVTTAAGDLAQKLLALPGTAGVTSPANQQERLGKLMALYGLYEPGLLAEKDRQALMQGKGEALYQRALQTLFSPEMPVSARSLAADPFFLLPPFLLELAEKAGGGSGIVEKDGLFHAPVYVALRDGTGLAAGQWVSGVSQILAGLDLPDGVSLRRTGQVFFSQAQQVSARLDVQRIGLWASLAIVAMFLLVFRSWVPLLLGLLTVGSGVLAGFASVLFCFSSVHVIALVFGTSLIGMAVDYALHLATVPLPGGDGQARLRRILPGLLLGLVTSVAGFAALAITPAVLLFQIAVFSATGLIAAFLTVFFVGPVLPQRPVRPFWLAAPALAAVERFYERLRLGRRARIAALLVMIAAAALAVMLVRGDDDIRRLGRVDPDLRDEAATISNVLSLGARPFVIRVSGASAEQRLEREEELRAKLAPLIVEGALQGLLSPADFIPSLRRQQQDRALALQALYGPYGDKLAQNLPVPVNGPASAGLAFDGAVRAALPELAALAYDDGSDLVQLRGVSDVARVEAVVRQADYARLIDPVEMISRQLGDYRHKAGFALALTALAALAIATWRYGWFTGLCVCAAPCGAVLAALLGSLLLGVPSNLFTTMALVLVFGVGADYVLFIAESRGVTEGHGTSLAVFLCLLSSLFGFGLLATSSVPLVSDIGSVIALGLVAAWLLAPLMARDTARGGEG
ncbi:MMPL family transporter [Radicibacter daui]|uniref:MMPL family transporter n=1 Tax=Radicibacter daui TaxID=3064829 RepID=UPI00404698F1